MINLHTTIKETILNTERDIALIVEPGMGLSSLLQQFNGIEGIKILRIEVKQLFVLWEKYFQYETNTDEHSLIIDFAIIESLLPFAHIQHEDTLFSRKTNLPVFLSQNYQELCNIGMVFVIIENIHSLPNNLAICVINRLKGLSDLRANSLLQYFRFIIGGAINFHKYFPPSENGNSPALNFYKITPNKFLLSKEECRAYLEDLSPSLLNCTDLVKQIIELSGGYLHYLRELIKLASEELDLLKESSTYFNEILFTHIIEKNRSPLLKYCYSAWKEIKNNQNLLEYLTIAVSIGTIYDPTHVCDTAIYMGLLIQKEPFKKETYSIPNKIVEMFLRVKLSELGLCTPLQQCNFAMITEINDQTFHTISQISNSLKHFLADKLFEKSKKTIEEILAENPEKYSEIVDHIENRMQVEKDCDFFDFYNNESFIQYTTSEELLLILPEGTIPEDYLLLIKSILREINLLRHRFNCNRTISSDQLIQVTNHWKNVIRLLSLPNQIEISIPSSDRPICILLASANPEGGEKLKIDEEFRDISEQIRLSKNREKFKIEFCLATRLHDFSQALLDYLPSIVHFSGHGSSNGQLCFNNEKGEVDFISIQNLKGIFAQFLPSIKCVVLNACYSDMEAEILSEIIPAVIAIPKEIVDHDARKFSIGFYQAIGAGMSTIKAFNLGVSQITETDIADNIPKFHKKYDGKNMR